MLSASFLHYDGHRLAGLPNSASYSGGFSRATFADCRGIALDKRDLQRVFPDGSLCGGDADNLLSCRLADPGGI